MLQNAYCSQSFCDVATLNHLQHSLINMTNLTTSINEGHGHYALKGWIQCAGVACNPSSEISKCCNVVPRKCKNYMTSNGERCDTIKVKIIQVQMRMNLVARDCFAQIVMPTLAVLKSLSVEIRA